MNYIVIKGSYIAMLITGKYDTVDNKYNELIYYVGRYSQTKLFYTHIAGITYPNRKYSVSRPNSKVLSVEFVINGKGIIHHGDKCFTVEKDDVFFLYPRNNHTYCADGDEPWEKIWVNIGGALVDSLIEAYGIDKQNVYRLPNARSYFDRIVEICQKESPPERIDDEVALVFHELLQFIHAQLNSKEDSASEDALTIRDRKSVV